MDEDVRTSLYRQDDTRQFLAYSTQMRANKPPPALNNDPPKQAPSSSASSTEVHDELAPLPVAPRRVSLPPRMHLHSSSTSPGIQSLSELMSSPPIPEDYENDRSYFPPFPSSQSPLVPSTPQTPDIFVPPKAASDSGIFAIARRSSTNRSPRIRNTGGILAPHGSFTSSRPRSSTTSSRSSVASSPSGRTPRIPSSHLQDQPEEMDPCERERLFKAAAKGDQLAMHQLGYRPPKLNHRHTLGSSGDIWGVSESTAPTSRKIPANNSPNTPTTSQSQSDLFSEAAHLASQSSATPYTSSRSRQSST
ncbi:uncharacterized protein IL334_005436 [Kwoniella shivajii]|uniref:Uncharacterized protein n=1 Tax=Kwoniella shivajii TaxID=564305 RepID=A0ABZ1D3J7_9TREE|nr:hypothetical protein IL334_005436 [Kwoniella shivajii]